MGHSEKGAVGRSAVGVRALTPIWDNVANENDVVMRCAQAFAAAFAKNPVEPRLRDIARVAGCSRNAVRKHLAEARRRGMLSLHLQLPKHKGYSQELAEKYDLAEAVVTLTPAKWNDQESIRSALAPEVIRYFERFCTRLVQTSEDKKVLRVGIDGGLTLHQAVREAVLSQFPKVAYELVPLVFGPLEGSKFTASTASIVANVLGSKLGEVGAEVRVLDGFTIKADWHRSPDKRQPAHFTITGKKTVLPLDILFVGIGSSKAGLLQRELHSLARSERAEIEHFGDILNLAFDQEGREYTSIGRNRAVLLSLKDLHRLSQSTSTLVVGVAGGKEKVEAIRTVLRCGYISVLITDPATTTALLE
jgi:DNA-binding transcriptional regulator LsrR (DeoR family)